MARDFSQELAALKADVDALSKAELDTPLASLAQWDSLTVLLTLSHFEHVHQLSLTGEQVRSCRTLRELLSHLPSSS
jgi:hypothetical protein